MIINVEQKYGNNGLALVISYIKKDGTIGFSQFNVPSNHQFAYQYAKQKSKAVDGLLSWDFQPVQVVPSQFLNKHRIQEFFIDAGEENVKHLFEPNMPNLHSVDIEVDVTDEGFAEAEDATNRINSITTTCYPNIVSFGVKPLTGAECAAIEKNINDHVKKFGKIYNFTYKYFENEADMLYDYLYNYARHSPLMTGWYFWGYDWQYICNRCKKLNLDIRWISPTQQWYGHSLASRKKDENGKELKVRISLPQHKLIVDYMEIYKKWDRTVEVKENDTLDFVAESVLGIRKVKYPGTLRDLFNKDFEQYIFYNAIDTVLVELIHEKIKTMGTFLGLGNITRVEAMSAFSPIAMLEATMTRYAYNRNRVFPKIEIKNKREEYKGAFVFEPKPDLYPWVASFDFASLYPSIMRQFMMSVENFVKKDKTHIPTENQIKCSSGAIFDNSYESLIPEILTDYYNQRKTAKKISVDAEKDMDELQKILKERKLVSQKSLM
jgi:DNA polymerase elongation subunit (family B)